MSILFSVFVLVLNLFILWKWNKRLKKKGKKLPWYWGWILPTDILMVVLYSLIGFLLIASFFASGLHSKKKKTLMEMERIKTALIKYENDNGHPNDIELLINVRPLRKEWTIDAWNHRYELKRNSNNKATLVSAGKDGTFGSKDDLIISLD